MDEQDLNCHEEFLKAAMEVIKFCESSQLPPPSAPATVLAPPAPEMSTISSSLTHAVQLQCSTVHASKRTNLEPDVAISSVSHREIGSTIGLDDKTSFKFKTTGVQADLANHADLIKKLQDIWCNSNSQDLRKNLISELLFSCSKDLQVLYSFMERTPPQEIDRKEIPKTSLNMQSSTALESEKVYQLYSAVTRISYGFVNLKTLVEPLLDLCKVENAILVHRSLHVLHVLLEHLSGFEKIFEAQKSEGDTDNAQLNRHSLFKIVHQIASTRTEENVKLEALSIMNILVMSTDAYTEREIFVSKEVFESISILLRNKAGFRVRREAIHLFYLLLNCPTLLAKFDSLTEDGNASATENDLFSLEALGKIFEGLADCLTSPRTTSQDLELCRSVKKILALATSSGNSGYELPEDTNSLILILKDLISRI